MFPLDTDATSPGLIGGTTTGKPRFVANAGLEDAFWGCWHVCIGTC